MGPYKTSFVYNRGPILHFHDYGRKGTMEWDHPLKGKKTIESWIYIVLIFSKKMDGIYVRIILRKKSGLPICQIPGVAK